jgi:DNA sulfur modification protein DndD
MWLENVTLTNLFCYHDEVSFDFKRPPGLDEQKNIAVIWGRNGYGKTSFLTGMKLLVGGIYDELRDSIIKGRRASLTQYLLGWADEWSGIVNTRAWKVARTEVRVAIEATWHDPKNGRIRVTREWNISKKTQEWHESLKIIGPDGRNWTGDDAKYYLSTIFPSDYIRFVMYDGEQIQELADGDEQERVDAMEKLLEIRPLDQLKQNLKVARTNWNRGVTVRDAQNELAEVDTRYKHLEAKRANFQGKLESKSDERRELQTQKDRLQAEIDEIQESSPTEDRARLIERRQQLQRELDIGKATIAVKYLLDAPFVFNRAVIHEVAAALQVDAEDTAERAKRDQLTQLQEELPIQVFDMGRQSQPALTDGQKRFYKEKLYKQLDGHKSEQAAGKFNFDLSEQSRERIRSRLQRFADDDNTRRDRLKILREYLDMRTELKKTETKLNDLSDLTIEKQNRAKELRAEIAKIDNEINRVYQDIGKLDGEIKNCDVEIKASNEDVEQKREAVKEAVRYARRSTIAQQLLDFVDVFAREVRKTRREALEKKINEHRAQLLSSNALVKRVKLDENFHLTYHTEGGVPIGKKNMSAGMRQLLATALLWALAEESGLDLPVIVDTPLARLDREHQAVLLKQYFARVSHQMIVLPTNSELDADKFQHIQPHVYVEHTLQNDEGNASKPIRKSSKEGR